MSIEQHVTSLELSKKLKELGVKKESVFYYASGYVVTNRAQHYYRDELMNYGCGCCEERSGYDKDDVCSAYLASELGDMLPRLIHKNERGFLISICKSIDNDWIIKYDTYTDFKLKITIDKTEADARAEMLIYLIENGHLKADEL